MTTTTLISSDRSAIARTLNRWLAYIGNQMANHRKWILGLQWIVVVFYVALVAIPAFLPLPDEDIHIWQSLTRIAQFAFWGIWWPFVMVSMMLMGRIWCGVLCPEGALSEWASKHGRQGKIPRWIRWGGWPFVSFACTTIVGQLTSIYQYPKPALLILGGSTAAAVVIGFLYGRGVRVWCRFLCPANGVFTLLSRLAPVHFAVDKQQWKAHSPDYLVDCPPILNVQQKAGTGSCHACGRCSDYRSAVHLQLRSPADEVSTMKLGRFERVEVFTLLFGLLGIALGAFQWSGSPWFVQMKQAIAMFAIDHHITWLLQDNAPWWLLTHYPEASDVFTWLDGLAIIIYISAVTAVVGGWMLLVLWLASKFIIDDVTQLWRLAYSITPLGGVSVFLGLSMLTLSQLSAEHIHVPYLKVNRAGLMILAVLWSLWLTHRIAKRWQLETIRNLALYCLVLVSMSPVLVLWCLQFYVW